MKILSRLVAAPRANHRLGADVLAAIGEAGTVTLAELLTRLCEVRPGTYDAWTPDELAVGLRGLRVHVGSVRSGGVTGLGVRRSAAHRAITGGAR